MQKINTACESGQTRDEFFGGLRFRLSAPAGREKHPRSKISGTLHRARQSPERGAL
jgi:hypothetical protein